jgi:hypothetical protein
MASGARAAARRSSEADQCLRGEAPLESDVLCHAGTRREFRARQPLVREAGMLVAGEKAGADRLIQGGRAIGRPWGHKRNGRAITM